MKIVTLLPSATEIVSALGLEDQLSAVSHECDYPPSVQKLPRITSSRIPHDLTPEEIDTAVVQAVRDGQALYMVDGDLLMELKPDLIITQGVCDVCAVNQNTVAQTLTLLPDLVSDDVQVLSLSGSNFAGVLRDVHLVAEATGTLATAVALSNDLQQKWQALPQHQPIQKPRVLMLEWPHPPFYGGHWVPEMVHLAGGIDCFGREGVESGRCTWEQISEQDPDMIMMIACGHNLAENVAFARELWQRPESQELRAVQTGQVWAFDANSYFSRPAPRLVNGAFLLQAIFNGKYEAVPGVVQQVTGVFEGMVD